MSPLSLHTHTQYQCMSPSHYTHTHTHTHSTSVCLPLTTHTHSTSACLPLTTHTHTHTHTHTQYQCVSPSHYTHTQYQCMSPSHYTHTHTHTHTVPVCVSLSPCAHMQQAILTLGIRETINLSISVLCDPGDNILVPSPGLPYYTMSAVAVGVETREYRLKVCTWHCSTTVCACVCLHARVGRVFKLRNMFPNVCLCLCSWYYFLVRYMVCSNRDSM